MFTAEAIMAFNKRLIRLRKKAGLSIHDAATQLGVTKRTWTGWERERIPSTRYALAICRMFQISGERLYTGRDRFTRMADRT